MKKPERMKTTLVTLAFAASIGVAHAYDAVAAVYSAVFLQRAVALCPQYDLDSHKAAIAQIIADARRTLGDKAVNAKVMEAGIDGNLLANGKKEQFCDTVKDMDMTIEELK